MASFATIIRGPPASLTGPGTKASLGGDSLFGDIGGNTIATPSFTFSEGTLSRTGNEFLNRARAISSNLAANRARFGTGFTEFTRARLKDIENVRARTVGSLRSQLGRRNILGASFAQDAITRTELGFAQQADRVRAEAEVAEFQLDLENLKVQQQANQFQLGRELQELDLSLQFVTGINQAILARDQIEAQLEIARMQRRTGLRGSTGGGGGGFTIGSSFGGGGSTISGSTGNTAISVPFTSQGATIPSTGPFAIGGFAPAGL
jgi:hypothetical protein